MRASDEIQTVKERVFKVLKSLYRLKQATRNWYDYIARGLAKLDF
jgi:hypothetical protein